MTDEQQILLVVAVAIVLAPICGAIRQARGGKFIDGAMMGLFLGPLGLLIATLQDPRGGSPKELQRLCPACQMPMPATASVCHRCQRESRPWTFHNGQWWWQDENDAWFVLDQTTNTWNPVKR